MITFLEYFGSKLSNTQRKWASATSVFDTKGNLRPDEGGITDITKTPKSRQHDASLNGKVERIRMGNTNMEVLSPVDVEQIKAQYKLADLDESHPKQLSNMPVTISFDPSKNTYILKRNV